MCLFFSSGAVPPVQNGPIFPNSWQDYWIMDHSDPEWILNSTTLHYDQETSKIVETTTFLDEVSLITANSGKRCNKCHIIKELHPNVLQIQTSICKAQVSYFLSFKGPVHLIRPLLRPPFWYKTPF